MPPVFIGFGVVVDRLLSRRHREATDLPGGYSVLLQGDGFEANHHLACGNDGIVYLSCRAHASRGFCNALADASRQTGTIIEAIGKLY